MPEGSRDRRNLEAILGGAERSRDLVKQILAFARAGRAERLEHERVDVIIGGMLVLARLMAHLGSDRCLASESDILDGLARTLLTPRLRLA